MKISIACGGTGGHLFPGLAMAEMFRQRGHTVTLWMDERAVDYARNSGWNGFIENVSATGLPGRFSLRSVAACFGLVSAAISCWRRMRRNKPDVILAMGSYASFGPVIAAKLCRIPIVLHEANAVPGRAISLLSRFADVVALTFAECASYFKCCTELTGFPVRGDIVPYFPEDTIFKKDIFTLLIMGGSQGAHFLNEVCSKAICLLAEKGVPIQVIHLAGKVDAGSIREKYAAKKVTSMVLPFLEDMGMAYGMADLAVCRAGASTCMELVKFGLPALLVPLPSARSDHQTANAKVLVNTGAADIIPQGELSINKLAEYINMLVDDASSLIEKKRCLKDIAVPDAAIRIAELVEKQSS